MPRVAPRNPNQRILPALPQEIFSWSRVADLPDRGAAFSQDLAQFARRQLEQRVGTFFGHQLRAQTGAAHQLTALADLELDVVNARCRPE